MFDFLKRKKVSDDTPESAEALIVNETTTEGKQGLFSRLKAGLNKTRANLTEGLGNIVFGKKIIDETLLEQLEEQLLLADVGVEACQEITQNLTQQISRRKLGDAEALMQALKQQLQLILNPSEAVLEINSAKAPFVILMVGVNGAGKTTTIGKLAKRLQAEGRKVMLAAGDTFRAAAIEQLQVWGERNQIPVIAQQQGADSASVAFDALQAAKARGFDVLIIDTAGRLHTQSNLMQELEKVKRVIAKIDPLAPHETLLVLDASNGQNALNQAKQFQMSVAVSGIALTKLDGTAKGGIIFAIAKTLKIPIRFIGVGEKIDDLRPFKAGEFVEALLDL